MSRTEAEAPRVTTYHSSLARSLVITFAYLVCLAGTSIGVGAFGGTPIAEASGGVLAADATHLAPASPAFSIWSVIYVGLGAYTLWQWWDREDRRRIAWLAMASMLLNAAWILLVQAGQIGLTVAVIVALVATLAALLRRLVAVPAGSRMETLVVDGTFGLYLGWVCVATCANIAAALAGLGFDGFGAPGVLAAVVLAVATAVGVALARYGRGRLAVAASLTWGLAWIAAGRTVAPESTLTLWAAVAAAVVVAATTVVVRLRRPRLAPATAGAAA
jgi:hypothetical protein